MILTILMIPVSLASIADEEQRKSEERKQRGKAEGEEDGLN